MDSQARFDEICDDLLARNGELELKKMMGMPSRKRNGKLVAGFAASEGAMVFKLEDPDAHARALAFGGAHLFDPSGAMVFKLEDPDAHARALAFGGAHLFDPSGRGRPFKEWVVVPPAHAAHWRELTEAALA